ncbi:MAG: DNA-primase RepB domain-containing protein [Vicinamibacterales bacterium]
MAIDLDAPVRFLRTAFHPDDWVAVLLKSHETGGTAQRVGPLSLIASPKFQAWLRAQSARRFSVFVSVNTIRPQRKTRTRDAIGEIRHVFLDADRDGPAVLATIAARRDLPPPSCVIHSSPNRLHVMWRATGFTKETVEALQKQLAKELGTDKAATSCAQLTRLPGFFNHKYRPGPAVTAEFGAGQRSFGPFDFPRSVPLPRPTTGVTSMRTGKTTSDPRERARRYLAAIPPAVAGSHGDLTTFRVCCRLVRGFALTDDDALGVLVEWNHACSPPWSEVELRSKLAAARRYGRERVGGLLSSSSERQTSV